MTSRTAKTSGPVVVPAAWLSDYGFQEETPTITIVDAVNKFLRRIRGLSVVLDNATSFPCHDEAVEAADAVGEVIQTHCDEMKEWVDAWHAAQNRVPSRACRVDETGSARGGRLWPAHEQRDDAQPPRAIENVLCEIGFEVYQARTALELHDQVNRLPDNLGPQAQTSPDEAMAFLFERIETHVLAACTLWERALETFPELCSMSARRTPAGGAV